MSGSSKLNLRWLFFNSIKWSRRRLLAVTCASAVLGTAAGILRPALLPISTTSMNLSIMPMLKQPGGEEGVTVMTMSTWGFRMIELDAKPDGMSWFMALKESGDDWLKREDLSAWVDVPWTHGEEFTLGRTVACGWPCICATAIERGHSLPPTAQREPPVYSSGYLGLTRPANAPTDKTWPVYFDCAWVPMRPYLPGFAANLLVFGLSGLIVTLIPTYVNAIWRAKHLRCPCCGYVLAENAVRCPECGTQYSVTQTESASMAHHDPQSSSRDASPCHQHQLPASPASQANAASVLAGLRRFGIQMTDVHPGNIGFRPN